MENDNQPTQTNCSNLSGGETSEVPPSSAQNNAVKKTALKKTGKKLKSKKKHKYAWLTWGIGVLFSVF